MIYTKLTAIDDEPTNDTTLYVGKYTNIGSE